MKSACGIGNAILADRRGVVSLLRSAPASGSCLPPSVDGVSPRRADEGLHEHAVEPELGGIAEAVEPDGHSFMAPRRLRAIGSEETIPPRQIESEVAVGLVGDRGMVDTMRPTATSDSI